MAITKQASRNVVQAVSSIKDSCVNWLQSRALTPEYKGISLYEQLFGDEPPITTHVEFSKDTQRIQAVLRAALRELDTTTLFQTITLPAKSKCHFSFTLRSNDGTDNPKKANVALSIPISKEVYLMDGLIYANNYGEKANSPRLHFHQYWLEGCPVSATHEFFLPHLVASFGAEFIEKVNSIIAFYDMTALTPVNLENYIDRCRSLGGLYKKLPILNTLIPRSNIDHVTMTRQTPDPPDTLVSCLNTLASVNSARIASTPQKKEED